MELIDFKLRDSFMDSFYNENLYDGGTLVIHINNEEIEKLNKLRESIFEIEAKVYPQKVENFPFEITGVPANYFKQSDAIFLGVREDIPDSLRLQIGTSIAEAKKKIIESIFSGYEDINNVVNIEFYFPPPRYISENQWKSNGKLIEESIKDYIYKLSNWLQSVAIITEGTFYTKYILNQNRGLFIIKKTFALEEKNLYLHIKISRNLVEYSLNKNKIDLKMLFARTLSKSLSTEMHRIVRYILRVSDNAVKTPTVLYLNKAEIYPIKTLITNSPNQIEEHSKKWMHLAYSQPESGKIQVALYERGRYQYIRHFSKLMVKEANIYLDLLKEILDDNEKESIYVDVDSIEKKGKTAVYIFSLFKSRSNSYAEVVRIFRDYGSEFPKKGTLKLSEDYRDITINEVKIILKEKILQWNKTNDNLVWKL